jgi:glycosyltransferase involved in cell wall biosynthesis
MAATHEDSALVAPMRALNGAATERPTLDLSVVIPVYNEEASVEHLVEETAAALAGWRYEILFINDGSTDGTAAALERARARDERVRVLRFRRNFGKAAALAVGLREAAGELIATMDGDLQDDPKDIPRLIARLREGYDMVVGWKRQRRDPWTKRWPSLLFNFTLRLVVGLRIHDYNCGLKVFHRSVTRSLHLYGENHRFIPALAHWQGFRVVELPVHHRPRPFGRSKYGPGRFLAGLLDLLTVLFLTRYERKPLHLFGLLGLLSFLAGVAINLYLTALWFRGHSIGTRPLLQLGVLLILMGVQFISLGLLGELMVQVLAQRGLHEPYYEVVDGKEQEQSIG